MKCSHVCLTLIVLPALGFSVAAAGEKPNLILCMADDLGWGDVGFNGNKVIRTPHLDAMAANGLRFQRFYAGAPVCSPTRGNALTGRHPYRYGIFSANVGHIRSRELTLAEMLKAQGYTTGHFGKWHLGTLTKTGSDSNRGGPKNAAHFAPPRRHGFDVNFSTEAKVPTWDPMLRPAGVRRRTWWTALKPNETGEAYGTAYWSNGKRVTEDLRGDDSRIIMDRAIPFMRNAVKSGRPFFSVIWFHAPHLPVVAGPKYANMYRRHDDYTRNYYGSITALDEQVGRLRKELRRLGVAGNTVLCFCSDNGPEGRAGKAPGSAGHLRGRKRDLFEGGIRVPGIVEWPDRIKPGRVTTIPACTSDYLPTMRDILTIRTPHPLGTVDGVSLLPVFENKSTGRGKPIGFQSGNQAAWIASRYKLIRIGPATRPRRGRKKRRKRAGKSKTQLMLFDIVADPAEKNDLAGQHPQIVKTMAAQLDSWQAACRKSLATIGSSKQ